MPPLSAAEVDEFATQGWLHLQGVLRPDVLEWARTELAPCAGATTKLDDLWVASDAVRAIATAAQVRAVVAQLYDAEPVPFQTLNFVRGSEQALHADDVHFDSVPSGRMCGVWVALEDVGEGQGPLMVVPGSHRWPELRPDAVLSRLRPFRYDDYERLVASQVGDRAPVRITALAGDVVIWDGRLVHGGAPVDTAGATRWSQVTHFVMRGAAYVTPMHSPTTPGLHALRAPLIDITDGRSVQPQQAGVPARVMWHGGGVAELLDRDAPPPPLGRRLASAVRGAAIDARSRVARARHRHRVRRMLGV